MSNDSSTRSYRQVQFRPSDHATRILLVRHGESEAAQPGQPFPLVDGRGDPSLSEIGQRQAEAIARSLAHMPIDALYVTPLRRTQQTAQPLCERIGATPTVSSGLIEVHMGAWEGGLYRKHISEGDPLATELFEKGSFDVIAGGESSEHLIERTSEAIAQIAHAHRGHCVVVFAHLLSIGAILAHATGSQPFAFIACANGSISEIFVDGGSIRLWRFNDTSHLS